MGHHSNIKLKEKNWDGPMGRLLQPSVIHEAMTFDNLSMYKANGI